VKKLGRHAAPRQLRRSARSCRYALGRHAVRAAPGKRENSGAVFQTFVKPASDKIFPDEETIFVDGENGAGLVTSPTGVVRHTTPRRGAAQVQPGQRARARPRTSRWGREGVDGGPVSIGRPWPTARVVQLLTCCSGRGLLEVQLRPHRPPRAAGRHGPKAG